MSSISGSYGFRDLRLPETNDTRRLVENVETSSLYEDEHAASPPCRLDSERNICDKRTAALSPTEDLSLRVDSGRPVKEFLLTHDYFAAGNCGM